MARISSTQPRKQRKFRYNAPIHIRGAFLHSPLASDLRKKYGKRSFRVVTGDTVKVLRGEFKGIEGVVDGVDVKNTKVLVHGVYVKKANGEDVPRPLDPSKIMITKLNTKDAMRVARLEVKA
ncbi:MAG: 50S ribosomal protein L24 [Methanocorpusculum sp.]|jgi:large subunit ribosomal protein L24|uniref:50S ribosomal protein L24 n=1 Tax=Methanocorpusculum sp. TaxID=2058474 RepID=UPI0027170B14|nr:50S ribosomal protein L24 [Methanocorpusculum sp.]MDO9522914.1 50S ribosomal protein L24 [Methanocorpusculum sp.]